MFHLSADSQKDQTPFFRKIDWAAFWTATIISFLVYFFTLGPSVTLEDSGELAVAGDHLGVPHPPGYPIWTMCAYLFSRLFSWVTYQGQPTPAWSISLLSAVFAALAAGITAMLITRSASDMVRHVHGDEDQTSDQDHALLCFSGGVGGSLAFAFSPVMWSQATIVEVYTLNAFFLMWIFLLTYRWMRRPSDKILWLTAFVFGLGLTNYQVLLLAALPLVVVIFLRNIALFRDFLLIGIPVLLTAHVLQIGAEIGAQPGMAGPAYFKAMPIMKFQAPSCAMLVIASLLVVAAPIVSLVLKKLGERPNSKPIAYSKFIGLGCGALGGLLFLIACAGGREVVLSADFAPLASPATYGGVAFLLALILSVSIGAGYSCKESWKEKEVRPWLIGIGVLVVVLLLRLATLPSAPVLPQYTGEAFHWGLPTLAMLGGLIVLCVLAVTVPKGIFYAIPVAAVQLAVFVLLRKGMMNGLTHPTTWWFWWPVIWNFILIGLSWMMLPNGRSVALTTFFAELGVAFYVYMPIVSDLRNPPMNWGYPRTWEGFKHAITRGQYEKIAPSDIFDSKFAFQLGSYFTDLRVQFTLIAATLGFLPFTLWSFRSPKRSKRFRALYLASGLYLVIAALVLISEVMHGEPFLRLDKILMVGIFLLLLIGMGTIVLQQIVNFIGKTKEGHNRSEGITVGLSLAGMAAVVCLFLAKGLMHALSSAEDPGILVKLAALILSVILVVGIGIGAYLLVKKLRERYDFKVDMDNVTQQWLIATAAGFLVMSVLLVALANIKGDLQDAFIQKVKFISSHGLFAIWIGYGLSFGLVIANRVMEWFIDKKNLSASLKKPLRYILIVMGICVALIPIYENYNNEWLVFAMSGAEQNGHDFGWQFGNYQLRGADAITEELDADEEPLPNPLYPPEMGTNAIFFGGTDPGRFVPTYMIYSANVRPDVFLITQNALADNTYMSTMRDLYGDDIWIPGPDDSANAFQVYVDEVQSGKRPKNAALTIENGRVQVSGALGVMEINGILCDMIFKKNKWKHPFYVEESYVIKWMYPYLTPHGLIMKINSEKSPISKENANSDMDFWDWYMRRLLKDPMFRRDLPAQKSFSKLRSAIAGLYASRGMVANAECSFQEACALYPVSPESNFRLVQEILLPQQRYAEALDILNQYNLKDPNNARGKEFAKFIINIQSTRDLIRHLNAKAQKEKRLSIEETLQLASAYQQLGQNEAAAMWLKQLASMQGLPPQQLFQIGVTLSSIGKNKDAVPLLDRSLPIIHKALPPEQLMNAIRIYAAAHNVDKMLPLMQQYLQVCPQDWQAWLNFATLSASKNQMAQAQYAIQCAIQYGHGTALRAIQQQPVLRQIAGPVLRQLQQQQQGNLNNLFGPRK